MDNVAEAMETETDTGTAGGAMDAPDSSLQRRHFDTDASIVLLGCRGVGKRSLGFIGALHLRRRLVMEDYYFEQVTGKTRAQYFSQHGREDFVRRNADVFRQMLDENSRRCLIVCGMSSFTDEAQHVLRAYCQTHPVIYVHREREQMRRFLDAAEADQLLRADERHRQCSNFEYYNLYDSSDAATNPPHPRLLGVKEDFASYLDLLHGQTWQRQWAESPFSLNAIPLEFRDVSFGLRLRLSYLLDMDLEWEDFEARGDCVELVIDHWPDNVACLVARQVALIRRKLAMPIIYHVEENPREERARSLEERDRMDAELLELGLRLNVEYISIDLQRSEALIQRVLAQRGHTAVLGNYWFAGLGAPRWSADVHMDNYRRAAALGCNIVRIGRFAVAKIDFLDGPMQLRERLEKEMPDPTKPPLAAFDYSVLGLCTPPQSRVLTPVKHPQAVNRRDHLATVCTAATAISQLFENRRMDALEFYTIGSHIDYSITPAIHSAAFTFTGLYHTFRAAQYATLDELGRLFLQPGSRGNETFGGATLAAPFKMAIRPHLKLQSKHAAALGAVNVILPLRGRTSAVLDHANARNRAGPCTEFYGDNTDWRAIHKCLQRAISPRNAVQPSRTTGLVIGAGGMARAAVYALIQLGCRHIFIYSRTRQHALEVAQHFDSWAQAQGLVKETGPKSPDGQKSPKGQKSLKSLSQHSICHVIDSIDDPWPAGYQPPTMVVSCVPAVNMDGSPAAEFEMPRQWLTSPTGGVVVEMAYEPLITPLVAQMQTLGEAASPAWVIVDGLQVVGEMAIEAFELLTGRMAPRRLMRSVCRQAWEDLQKQPSAVANA